MMWPFGSDSDDEGMELFIGNLPDKVSTRDLEEILGDYAAEASLKINKKLFADGSETNFCVASFDSAKVAKKVIKAINNKKLAGEYLSIHEFTYRSYQNDRRLKPYSPIHTEDSGNDHRHVERRRKEKAIDPFTLESEQEETTDETRVKVSGYKDFAHKG